MGEHHSQIRNDPAIDRFNTMRESVYLNFRWTRRTTRTAIVGCLVVPAIAYYLAGEYTNKFDWMSRKGEPLVRSTAKPE